MIAALKKANIQPEQIDYINAHGTSTMADVNELAAVERMMGEADKLTMSSTKSSTGHLLGAAGAIEAIFTTLAIRDQVVPPTINLDKPAVSTRIDLAANKRFQKKLTLLSLIPLALGERTQVYFWRKYKCGAALHQT